jgi:hypothetical protein
VATAFAFLLVLHASIHLLGAAKAFGWADLSQLTQSVSQAQGLLWLASALLFTVTATADRVSSIKRRNEVPPIVWTGFLRQ